MAASTRSLFLGSAKMALATFASRILGLVREQVIAFSFGASHVTDAFWVAYRIPNLLRDLFAEGAFSSAFVPSMSKVKQKGHEQTVKFFWSIFFALLITTGLFSIITIIFAEQLVSVFAPSFLADPEKFLISVRLTQIMAPFLLFVSLAALFMGTLNTYKIFFVPSFAPACFNVTMILTVLICMPLLVDAAINPIYALAIGVFLGGLVQCIVQIPSLAKLSFAYLKPEVWWSSDVKGVLRLMSVGMIGFAATQINLLVGTILATGSVVGAVSWLSYSFRLFQFPVGVLGVSIAGSNLVHFSESYKLGDKNSARNFLQQSYTLSLLMILPATALLWALAEPVVQVVFERGKFSVNDTAMTTLALQCYLVGLPFYGLYKLFVPLFYTFGKPRLPIYASAFSIGVNIIFSIFFIDRIGFHALALGTSLSMLVNCLILGVFLRRHLELQLNFFLSLRSLKILFSAIIAFIVCYWSLKSLPLYDDGFIFRCIKVSLIGVIGLVIYLGSLFCLGEKEFFRRFLDRRSKKS